MTQHTPGPWNLFYDEELELYQLDDGHDVFAQLDLREKNVEANARLLLSAPDLLEEIIEMVEVLNQGITCAISPTSVKANKLRAVIAKVRGT